MTRSILKSALAGAMLLGVATAAFAATGEYDNMCTMGLALGKDIKTDCSINATIQGKMYCFGNDEAKTIFMKDPAGNLAKAQAYYSSKKQQRAKDPLSFERVLLTPGLPLRGRMPPNRLIQIIADVVAGPISQGTALFPERGRSCLRCLGRLVSPGWWSWRRPHTLSPRCPDIKGMGRRVTRCRQSRIEPERMAVP